MRNSITSSILTHIYTYLKVHTVIESNTFHVKTDYFRLTFTQLHTIHTPPWTLQSIFEVAISQHRKRFHSRNFAHHYIMLPISWLSDVFGVSSILMPKNKKWSEKYKYHYSISHVLKLQTTKYLHIYLWKIIDSMLMPTFLILKQHLSTTIGTMDACTIHFRFIHMNISL